MKFCAIPARAGSKRLARKNLQLLAGRPMIAHSIQAAQESELFAAVYVCTEDCDIAEQAQRYGAQVPHLMPADLCGDLVPSHVPCQYLANLLNSEGASFETLVCLQPSSPLRTSEEIRAAVDHFDRANADFLVSVTPVDPHYFHWAVLQEPDGNWGMYFGDKYLAERQSLPLVYRPNGSIKIARLSSIAEVGNFFGPGLQVLLTPEEHSIHVATALDLALCEFLIARDRAI